MIKMKMKEIKVDKVTLNIGAGKDQRLLDKGVKLIKNLTGKDPVKTVTQKRIQGWGLRPGLPIGAKLTLRGKEADEMIKRVLYAKENNLEESHFDNHGNISFGLPEYVDIKDAKYDTEIGMMGLQVSITLTRPGFRIKHRKIRNTHIPSRHQIKKEEAMSFMKEKYSAVIGEE